MKIEHYCNKAGKWTWRLVARNGRVIANAAEDYERPSGAMKAALKMQSVMLIPGGEVPIVNIGPDRPQMRPKFPMVPPNIEKERLP